jgi:hypothetical protein
MVEPLARSLAAAPIEEEELTVDTVAALDRARFPGARRGYPAGGDPAGVWNRALIEDLLPERVTIS